MTRLVGGAMSIRSTTMSLQCQFNKVSCVQITYLMLFICLRISSSSKLVISSASITRRRRRGARRRCACSSATACWICEVESGSNGMFDSEMVSSKIKH